MATRTMPHRRKILLCGLAMPLSGFAQSSAARRVGILTGRSRQAVADSGIDAAFAQAMRGHGYIEGGNVAYDWRFGAGDYDELRRLGEDLARVNVDVIVVDGTSALTAARQATSTIPIVMATASDPVAGGFVQSLARPGGNVTGLTSIAVEATPKRLELLVAIVPRLTHVAALTNENNRGASGYVKALQAAAGRFKLTVVSVQAASPSEIDAAFSRMAREKVQALIVAPDSLLITQCSQIVKLTTASRLPAVFPTREFFDAGGLMMYGVNIPAMFRRSTVYVDKILKGAKPAELPVEQPDALDLLLNVKAAKEIGVHIPQALLMRANEVVR